MEIGIEQDFGRSDVRDVHSDLVVRRGIGSEPFLCQNWHSADDWEQKRHQICLVYATFYMDSLKYPFSETDEAETS